MLDKVDHFVDEFVGKDLRDEVVREAKKQVELKIRAQIKIHQRKESAKKLQQLNMLVTLTGKDLQHLVA